MTEDQIPNTPPPEQFRDDVLPPYEAYMSDMGSRWKARAAGNAVAHFAEHVHRYYKHYDESQLHSQTGKAENFVKHLTETHDCHELKIIWDFAIVGKHRFAGKNVQDRSVLSDTGSIIGRTVPSATGAFVPDIDSGRLWMPDCDRWFDDVLEKAVDFWRGWLETAPTHP